MTRKTRASARQREDIGTPGFRTGRDDTCMAKAAASSLRRCALTLFSSNVSVTLQNSLK